MASKFLVWETIWKKVPSVWNHSQGGLGLKHNSLFRAGMGSPSLRTPDQGKVKTELDGAQLAVNKGDGFGQCLLNLLRWCWGNRREVPAFWVHESQRLKCFTETIFFFWLDRILFLLFKSLSHFKCFQVTTIWKKLALKFLTFLHHLRHCFTLITHCCGHRLDFAC